MNAKHFLLISLLAFSTLIVAQDNSKEDSNFKIGPKFGLDVSTATTKISTLTEQLNKNYQVGLFMQMGKKIYFQPEIYYSSYTTDATINATLNYVKAPMMLGWEVFDIGLVSLHLNGGPSYLKQLDSTNKAVINWEAGAGVNVLGFITTDLRYTFQKSSTNGFTQVQQLISNGGMVNLTVGLRL